MPTTRAFARRAFQCGLYEAQDVLCESDDVDLLGLQAGPGFSFKQQWQRRLLYRDISRRLIFMNPGVTRVRLTRDYDVFVAVCQNYWDLLALNAVDGWKDHCKTSIIWLDEIWAALIPQYKYWLHALTRFDHIFVGCSGSTEPLSKAIGRQCHWLPAAVDTRRFSPYPNPPQRVIDVYSIGRRHEGIHETLLRMAAKQDIFYVHDTCRLADAQPFSHRRHRDLLANMAKRSRYFVVAPAKVDDPSERKSQIELGYRYYEGAAAGAVMIGQTDDHESFRRMFGWKDAVISLRPDGSDVRDVLAYFNTQPQRLQEISRRNAAEALLRHDWIHRWKEMFTVAGIEPSPGMLGREARLKALACAAKNGQRQ